MVRVMGNLHTDTTREVGHDLRMVFGGTSLAI